jgi:copper(I)-binding protein
MFMDLKRPLKEGETFSGTLTFEKAGRVDVTFEVQGLRGLDAQTGKVLENKKEGRHPD